jgi:hypothetical protein
VSTAEVQKFVPPDSGLFQLSFGGATTTQFLPSNTDFTTVSNALNSLSTIQAAGGVSVTGDFTNGFTITFNFGGVDQSPIHILDMEKQTFNFPLLRYANSNGLVFQVTDTTSGSPVVSTVTLPGNASAADVQSALNSLPAIDNHVSGDGHDGVTVSLTSDNTFTIKFNNVADDAKLDISAFQNLPAVVSEPIPGQNTPPAPIMTIQQGDASTSEVQSYTPPANGTYILSFNNGSNDMTMAISHNATASEVAALLNQLPSIQAAGGVTVNANGPALVVHFLMQADQPDINIAIQVQDTQRFDVTNIGNFSLSSASVAFSSSESTPGDGATMEVQHFAPVRTTTPFQLSFNGQNTTTALPMNATAAQVEAALNSLSTVATAGGVHVTGDATNGYDVTFQQNGNQPAISGQNVTDQLAPTASPALVQAKLRVLLGADVTVTGGAEGIYDVTFPDVGVQSALSVTETHGLVTPTGSTPTGTIKLQVDRQLHFSPEDFVGYTEDYLGNRNIGPLINTFAPNTLVSNPTTGAAPVFHPGAHIVGAIADFNELGADVFKYIDTNGDGKFTVGDGSGDIPVDGLLAAKTFNPNAPTNFTAQARYVLNVIQPNGKSLPETTPFFDFNNQI